MVTHAVATSGRCLAPRSGAGEKSCLAKRSRVAKQPASGFCGGALLERLATVRVEASPARRSRTRPPYAPGTPPSGPARRAHASHWASASYTTLASPGGAAWSNDGRRPRRQSPYRVNCETRSTAPSTSSHRPMKPMVRIFKDAQPDDLVRQVGRIGRVIVASDTNEHEQSVLDGGHQPVIHAHTCRGHTLDDGSHACVCQSIRPAAAESSGPR